MNVEIIKNRAEHKKALQRLSELMDKNPVRGSREDNELELLVLVIQNYEQKVIEPIQSDPIEAIKFRMEQMQLTRKELVPYIGSISKVSEVLSGKRNLSLPMIRKLHEGLGIPLESLISRTSTVPKRKKQTRLVKSVSARRRRRVSSPSR
jgi:HTH-type transcriptional regulator/antitoxin HigA